MRQPTTAPEFDPKLVARYDVAGPRYTSYPTAPQFHAGFDEAALRRAVDASNAGAAPLSLYVHVPFCFSPCFYCGCHRVITRDARKATEYLDYLEKELALLGPLFARGRPVHQLHLGGGTPSFLDIDHMQRLFAMLARHFDMDRAAGREWGIEIDPRGIDAAYMSELGRLGFNRLSVGIQDFDAAVQEAVNRVQSVEQTRDVLRAARGHGFTSASVDLIYGLPHQHAAGFARTLDQVIALGPDRVAIYGYAHLPHLFKAQQQIDEAHLPDAASRLALLGLAWEKLTTAGYVYVGMDHFARASDELVQAQQAGTLQRNFQGYSTHGDCDIVGLGVSAIGRIANTYNQNARDLVGYYAALDAGRLPVMKGMELSTDDIVRRELIGELMCHGTLDTRRFGARHDLVFADHFADDMERLAWLVDDGLVELRGAAINVTPRGRPLLRNIAMCFDAYLRKSTGAPRYSRTI
ncbi:oxygen-independent coproporphyrinogen III oxidase [Dyella sp. C11]|uniref:oxygen-independent coproporphyrinogen III oxidase n=1 Tax=Dyella sp. C11 TaxID=2126991 RepID=UPI000D644E4A|nr:oxygen-independent coproporphyrinogen III oxidase [Dyella sp. C11]